MTSSKTVPHQTVPAHKHSSQLTLLYQQAVLLQELLSSIPLNISFPTITRLSDFIYFFQCEQLFFLNKLTTDQLNIMQVSTLSNSLQCQNSQVMHLAITWVRILQIFLLGHNYIPILSKIKHFRLYSTAEYHLSCSLN